ncbi:M48 family metalloprotease [Microvirga massiliensis]|uniref:M48 family metalloprotease n=1 Tax=Microvirga massiliensis TaxID=1033741 RepID=UPI0011C70423|nr:M48 family metalloprotease [Microvirga massiliensis]
MMSEPTQGHLRRRVPPSRIVGLAVAFVSALAIPASAQQSGQERRGQSIVRDAETEDLLRDYAVPIFQAAKVNAKATKIILVNDRSFNAFVANGQKIFINVGALLDAETPGEVIGVIAHETGHIAGGHLARLRQQVANAKILSVIGMLAGAGAMVGAANSGSGVGNTGTGAMGILTGGQELVRRNLLAYQRSEEQAADAAALRYLAATGQSPRGMLTTFARFADSGLFRSRAVDPYLISHPLPSERISQLERLAKQSPHFGRKDSPELQARHDLMRAKLAGFVERPDTVLRRYPPSNTSAPARYARAVLAYRSGRLSEALAAIDGLVAEQPSNAYFHELKGQALLESGRAREAVAPLRRAVSLAPGGIPIRVMLGQALLATGDADAAIRELSITTQREPESPDGFRFLAMAYGRKGDIGRAELASAQAFFNSADLRNAQTQASRAMAKLKPGSPAYLKAEDILNYRPSQDN